MALISFVAELDDCTFLSGSAIDESEKYIGTQGSIMALDYKDNIDDILPLVAIKVIKNIDGKEFFFYTKPTSRSIDSLKIYIEFFKALIFHYDEIDPTRYSFEWKGQGMW